MTRRVSIGGSIGIRVSAPGFDAETDGLDKMLLAIGMQTGQILSSGSVGLSAEAVPGGVPGTKRYPFNVIWGPFDSVPNVFGRVRLGDGFVRKPSVAYVATRGLLVALASNSYTATSSGMSGFINGIQQYASFPPYTASDVGPQPAVLDYVIFKRAYG